jgi:hypothetical protein
MTAEVEKKTEADWAIMYAEERKLRIKCQERLASMMCNGPALAATAKELCMAAVSAKEGDHSFIKMLVTVIKNANDMATDISINVFDPVAWKLSDKERETVATATCFEEMGEDMLRRVSAHVGKCAKNVSEEWHEICHARGLKCPAEIDHDSEQEFKERLLKRAMDEIPTTKAN